MNTLIEHLAEACREHLLHEKWLIAPSRRVGHQWLDRVARAGAPVVNVHVQTIRGLAMKVLAPRLADGRVRVASPAVRRLVVAAAWHNAMSDDGYLGSARLTPGLLALAEASLGDLCMAGLTASDLTAGGFELAAKGRELKTLLAAYRAELDRRGLIDHADAVRLAAEYLGQSGAAISATVVLLPDDLRLTAVEKVLRDAVAAAATVVDLPVDRPVAASQPAGPDAALPLWGQADTPDGDLALLRWIERPAEAPDAVGDGAVRIVHAVGEINEVRGVLRACLGESLALDTVEVLYTSADTYAPLIYDTAQRIFEHDPEKDLGVPVTFADGVPARLSRPGRLLAAWHSWVHDGFPQSGLLRMLQAGLLRLPVDEEGDPVSAARLARMLRSVGIGFGRDRYARVLKEKVESIGQKLDGAGQEKNTERLEQRLQSASALAGLVDALMEVSPSPGASAARTVSCARTLIRERARISGSLDGLARQRLLAELDGMAEALGSPAVDPPGFDAWEWLSELPDGISVGGSGPRPGHLHVASVRSGGHTGRPHTFIVGLDDGRFPSAGRQDPLLLDLERERLARTLPTAARRLREQIDEFTRLLSRLRGRVTMSFSSRSLDDDRETFAAPVVLAAYRLVSGRRDGDHAALMTWLDPAISFAPRGVDRCLDTGEWWLHQAAAQPPVANLRDLADGAFVHLSRGHDAAAQRASIAFSVYDGRVEDPGPELDPTGPGGPALSASSLQLIGRCPLAYFYEKVLRVSPPEDVEVDPGRWLNPLQFGTLLHEVLFEFVGALVAENTWPPQPDRDLPRMARIVQGHAERARRSVPPPGEDAYRRQRRQLDRSAEIFVNEQARQTGPDRPVYLEASIGMPSEQRRTDIDAPEPVELPLPGGGAIRVRARIDRIDRVDDDGPTFVIYDYKSGGYTKHFDTANPFNQGRLVQHALYMAVVRAVLETHAGPSATVDEFRFLFPGVRTHGRAITYGSAIVEPGLRVIENLCRLPAVGAFPATDDPEDCKYCDHRAACQAVQRNLKELCDGSKQKIDNARNTALEPFRELRRGG